jgi:hypothetical protein
MAREGQIVTIKVNETILRIYDQRDHLITTASWANREVARHRTYSCTTNHKTG